jgi:cyclopropane-fatty-acyl-phospholipid synthase
VQDWRRQAVPRWRLRRFGGDPRRAAENIHHHYDIGNDFYRLWLDRDLVYTCAYFPAPEASLEEAQQAKLDYVCRKVGLRRGETVFEAGCGWGALALHMARRYGARVRAWNISSEQVAYARARAEAEGLADRVEFVLDDYRAIEGRCDVFVSVGMLEHVGPRHYRELGAVIDRTLDRTRGRGLLHFIGRDAPAPLNVWITRRVFPGAYPPSLREAIAGVLEPFAFSVTDVENLRLHYARTLAHWLERFERRAGEVREMYDEAFVRTWRLYLAGAQASFAAGSLQLFQVTFARNGLNDVPWTRAGLYAASGETASPARAF